MKLLTLFEKFAAPVALAAAISAVPGTPALAHHDGDKSDTFSCKNGSLAGLALPDLAEKLIPATVTIFASEGIGSGVIIDGTKKLIVTNNHVVEKSQQTVEIMLYDAHATNNMGKIYAAHIVGKDPQADIAVLKITDNKAPSTLPCAEFNDGSNIRVGQSVFAVGAPFERYFTLTNGVVSGKNRLEDSPYQRFIQTNTAINPGNSGGPLFDMNGKIAGINTQILTKSGKSEETGFALDAPTVKSSAHQLVLSGVFLRTPLGVTFSPTYAKTKPDPKLAGIQGVYIEDVAQGSAANKAGIKPGDIITSFGGHRITSTQDLSYLVKITETGNPFQISVVRNGKEKTLTAVFEKEIVQDSAYSKSDEPMPELQRMPRQTKPPEIFRSW